ncbi:T-box-containing protein TBX6L-like [Athalia rosae]|uniref:T-box-containing protein TBX6L-like n=1 Tax=Athalia rosae TaxID=37344 RepID=UPI00203461D9|nr:T-box-containing protein TBX6L-like [Athalia rosae]
MFPSLQLQIEGLERRARYCILLEVAPASRRRHKYVGGGGGGGGGGGENGGTVGSRGWTSAGPAEPQPHFNRRVYLHPDSPATGSHWMQHPVSFNKLKLTNNAVDHHSNVVLTSMHKYVPRIWIARCDDIARLTSIFTQPASSFCFPETEFIAVTAYQNENITKLKIDNNPFAKGFRETGQSRCKRKLHTFEGPSDPTLDADRLGDSGSFNEDEESNASCSESESVVRTPSRLEHEATESQRAKRAASETGSLDDSGVSSSGSASPPLLPNKKLDVPAPQPRLHRPWTDEETARNRADRSSPKSSSPSSGRPAASPQSSRRAQRSNQPSINPRHILPAHLQVSAIELARIQQLQHRYHRMQYEQYCQMSHMNQLHNLAFQIPFAGVAAAGLAAAGPFAGSRGSPHPCSAVRGQGLKYHFDLHSPVGTPPAHSPTTSSADGASSSSS